MSKTNCRNCGAALDIFSPKCAFCGTKNINMTDIDLASGEPANFIFKLPNNFKNVNGEEIFLSILAIPELNTIEMQNDSTDIYGGFGNSKLTCINNYSLEVGLNLHAVTESQHNSFCNLTIN